MSEKKKSIAKWLGALLALLGGMEGADLAGFTPDSDLIKTLGIGSGVVICVYLHTVWLPIAKRMEGKLDRALGTAPAPAEPVVEPEELELAPRRAATHPGLKVIKPAREP